VPRGRVPGYIRARFLDHPVEGGLDVFRQALVHALDLEVDLDLAPLAQGRDQFLGCGHEAVLVEARRAEVGGNVVQLLGDG
jgi:hypothetical protein